MSSVTLKFTRDQLIAMQNRLQSQGTPEKTPPYALYRYHYEGCSITAYESGKLLIQGKDAEAVASLFAPLPDQSRHETAVHNRTQLFPQAGSDEVGTGDYFGPMTVCACVIEPSDVSFVQELGVMDSKAMKDETILKIGPLLAQRLKYSLLVLDNPRYNAVHDTNNMVALKSKLHNQAYVHLRNKRGSLPQLCVVDQFVQAKSYYRYLEETSDVVQGLHFETKAESHYLAVAAASVIARYAFLKHFEAMCSQYDFPFEKGAGAKVDACGRKFVERFGSDKLYAVAKLHFKNTEKILKS